MPTYNPGNMRIVVGGREVASGRVVSITDGDADGADALFGRGSALSSAARDALRPPLPEGTVAWPAGSWQARVIASIPAPRHLAAAELRARGLSEGWLR